MATDQSGAYGKNLAHCFRMDAAPAFVSRSMRHGPSAVTHIICDIENNGLTEAIPCEDAFLITLQLRDCPRHDLWIDGKSVRTGPLKAGTTCIYDLRRSPVVNSISAFTNLHFYFTRGMLEEAADGASLSALDDLPHNPGIGIQDSVIRDLGLSLLPAFERPDEITSLFVDHVTTAAAAYVAHLYQGNDVRLPDGGLSERQLHRSQDLLHSRLDGAVTLAELAVECGMTVQSFCAAFRVSTGLTPARWLLERRVDCARAMLSAGRALPEAAATCGFVSARHLLRAMDFPERPRD